MLEWLDTVMSSTRVPISGISSGSWESRTNPQWKLLLHTTEGHTIATAENAYRNGGYAPNVTCGSTNGTDSSLATHQHLSLNSRSTTLADAPGGIRPNREHVIQVEIVGFCDPNWSNSPLYIHNWSTRYKEYIAKVLNHILDGTPVPRKCTVTWKNYPGSYGKGASQRISATSFIDYAGILGHQHAPENSHGDPGSVTTFVNNYLLGTEPVEDWFDMATKADLEDVVKTYAVGPTEFETLFKKCIEEFLADKNNAPYFEVVFRNLRQHPLKNIDPTVPADAEETRGNSIANLRADVWKIKQNLGITE